MTRHANPSRRGTVYVLVLVVVALSTLLAITGLTAARIERRSALATTDAGEAADLARAGLDMGLQSIAADTSWRADDPVVVSWTIDDHRGVETTATDPGDGALNDGACENVQLQAAAWSNDGAQTLSLLAYFEPDDTASDMILALQPVSYWPLRNLSGVAIDRQGVSSGVLGAGVNTVGGSGSTCWGAPVFTGASNSYILIADHDGYNLDRGSIAMWVRIDDNSSTHGLFSKAAADSSTANMLTIAVEGSRLRARLRGDSADSDLRFDNFGNRTWRHVVFTFGERGSELWVDGALCDSDSEDIGFSVRTSVQNNTQPIVLGELADGSSIGAADILSSPMRGRLREVAVFAYQLEPSQIAQLALEPPEARQLVPMPNTIARVAN